MGRTAEDKDCELLARQYRQTGALLTREEARILRLAEKVLKRWDEKRCGWSSQGQHGGSYALVRDEDGDGKPYIEIHPNVGLKTTWEPIPDREAGALRRVAKVCERHGLEFFHQSDPRGCSLYIAKAGMILTHSGAVNNSFVACSVR